MPFKSEAQRRYLWSQEPEVAARFAKETPKNAKLPMHVADKQRAAFKQAKSKKK
jgi:hypothetical protein